MLAYFEGELVPVNLKPMPASSWDALRRHEEKLGDFYDGVFCICCVGSDSVGVGVCFFEAPVLRALDEGPLYRAFSILWRAGDPPGGGSTSFSQIEAAVSEGRIRIFREPVLYRLTVKDRSVLSKIIGASRPDVRAIPLVAEEPATWGSVKAMFR